VLSAKHAGVRDGVPQKAGLKDWEPAGSGTGEAI